MKRAIADLAGFTCVAGFWLLFFATLLAGGGR